MSHRYIVSSTPYLVTSGRPIYKVQQRPNITNPNHMKNGTVQNIVQIGVETHNSMQDIIIETPQNIELEQEVTIHIEVEQEEVQEPIKTRKVRVGNKVQIVPVETYTISIL